MIPRTWLSALLSLAVAAPAYASPPPAKKAAAAAIRRAEHGDFIISNLVTDQALPGLKREGVTTVIDLREMTEKGDCGQAITAAKLGMKYYAAPMAMEKPVTAESIARIEDILREKKSGRVVVYCPSGNRAAAWLAVHLAQKEHLPPTEALQIAKRSGLTSAAVEGEVREYLKLPSSAAK